MKFLSIFLIAIFMAAPLFAFELEGKPVQGGLLFGWVPPGTEVKLDLQDVMVSADGRFVIGFGRNESGMRSLSIHSGSDNTVIVKTLEIAPREYAIERVDGLPPQTITPDPSAAERIRMETQMVVDARQQRFKNTGYARGFDWPATGRISGVYGSQRILNGEPGRPHYGLDIAAPTGTLVRAPADGVITLAHPDMYFSGGTIILDHGQGLSSTFLHLSEILVEVGKAINQGDAIGRIGSTGRASGPHLDWRMNWMNKRVDPRPLLPDTSETPLGTPRIN